MKIALCLSGYIGNVDKWIKGEEIDYNYGYKYIKEAILDGHDVDVFIHSWSVPHEEGLKQLYNPVSSVFEENKDFKLRNTVSKEELPTPYSFAVKSMWYSRKKSVELVEEYQKKNNIEYDFILLTRFDIALFKKFEFEKYDKSKIYIAGPVEAKRHRSGKVVPHKINDIYFMSNLENMKKVVSLYDTYEDIAVEQNKNWPLESVSSHIVITKHFLNQDMFDITKTLFTRVWQSSMAWDTGGDIRFLRADPNLKTIKK